MEFVEIGSVVPLWYHTARIEPLIHRVIEPLSHSDRWWFENWGIV